MGHCDAIFTLRSVSIEKLEPLRFKNYSQFSSFCVATVALQYSTAMAATKRLKLFQQWQKTLYDAVLSCCWTYSYSILGSSSFFRGDNSVMSLPSTQFCLIWLDKSVGREWSLTDMVAGGDVSIRTKFFIYPPSAVSIYWFSTVAEIVAKALS